MVFIPPHWFESLAFDNPETEARWKDIFNAELASRVAFGCFVGCFYLGIGFSLAIFNPSNRYIVEAHPEIYVLSPAVLMALAIVGYKVSRPNGSSLIEGEIQKNRSASMNVACCIVCVGCTMNQWLFWEGPQRQMVADGTASVHQRAWAQANISELAWFYSCIAVFMAAVMRPTSEALRHLLSLKDRIFF